MISRDEKTKQLEVILNSKTFEKSPTSSRLLKFLTESTLEEKQLKENTVGIALFGESFLNDTSSSRIRVNIYNLRKKLTVYYLEEGKNDLLRIHIEKGQYYTQFVSNKQSHEKVKNYKKYYSFSKYLNLILIIGGIVTTAILLYKPQVPLWHSFFNNKKETTVVVGDFFGVMGKTVTGRIGWNRDYYINSSEDLYQFKEEHKALDDGITEADYTYMTGMGAIGIQHITRLFTNEQQHFSIRFSTKSNYNDIKERNTIYIGPTKNENKFIQYFNERNKRFSFKGRKLHYDHPEKGKDTIFNLDIKGLASEFAIVSRIKGTNGTEQFLFFSDHDIGVIAAIELFCDLKKLKAFKQQHLGASETFTAVFKVNGKERTNLDLKLILVDTKIEL